MGTELSVGAVTPREQAEQVELGPGCSSGQGLTRGGCGDAPGVFHPLGYGTACAVWRDRLCQEHPGCQHSWGGTVLLAELGIALPGAAQ